MPITKKPEPEKRSDTISVRLSMKALRCLNVLMEFSKANRTDVIDSAIIDLYETEAKKNQQAFNDIEKRLSGQAELVEDQAEKQQTKSSADKKSPTAKR